MINEDTMVETTADGLVVIRTGDQAKALGIIDPFAPWFVTAAGRQLVQVAKHADRVYEEFSLARFKYTTSRLNDLAQQFKQMVFLGSGFDCRAVWLEAFQSGQVTTFEVDTLAQLRQKTEILQNNGVNLPPWNHSIVANLRNDPIPSLLAEQGLQTTQPIFTLLEGLLFYLPPEVARRVLDPDWLQLTNGSKVLFDSWSELRVQRMNVRAKKGLGVELFHNLPFSTEPDQLKVALNGLGYREVSITPLDELATNYYQKPIQDEFPSSWFIVEATV